MQYRLSETPAGPAVIMTGRFTHADRDTFGKAIKELGSKPITRLTFDLAGLDFIDSAALGMILLVRQQALLAHYDIALRGAKGQVRTLIGLTRFGEMFLLEE